jgi:hypothetical protein
MSSLENDFATSTLRITIPDELEDATRTFAPNNFIKIKCKYDFNHDLNSLCLIALSINHIAPPNEPNYESYL